MRGINKFKIIGVFFIRCFTDRCPHCGKIRVTKGAYCSYCGEDGLIAKARKEINNLAEAETIEMDVAGKSTIENNRHIFWIITGNEYQIHRLVRKLALYMCNNVIDWRSMI